MMNVLVIGGGGREHALAWKLKQSPQLGQLYISPGNAGTHEVGQNTILDINDFDAVGQFCLNNAIDMVVVGPEAPLVKGICDYFTQQKTLRHILCIGPSAAAAQLEGSKDFAKAFMQEMNIPTARYASFTADQLAQGLDYLGTLHPPYVLKADGLAAGKGVLILPTLDQARAELQAMLGGKFGPASDKVVIEEFLQGIEASVFVLTDGKNYKLLPTAKDYKRIGEGDTGLNTGGMGAISPVAFADQAFMDKVETRIIQPTIKGLQSRQLTYKGFIFLGLMNVNGEPYVIEYNVRLGDPEAEVILPRIQSDLLPLLRATAQQTLHEAECEIDTRAAATVMMVSGGYPGSYEKGHPISGLNQVKGSTVFHAGTKIVDNKTVTSGGRVLAVTSLASHYTEALQQTYIQLQQIQFHAAYYRKDIGFDL